MNTNTTIENKKKIRIFFFKFCLLIALLVIIDYLLGDLMNYLYFNQKRGADYRLTYAIENTNADILVMGSSRAKHHYHPEIFKTEFDQSFFSTGRNDVTIFFDYSILISVLKRYRPKMIILDFGWWEFEKNKVDYDRIASLLPYYKTHPELRPIINIKSNNEKIKLLSHVYPYNSLILTIISRLFPSKSISSIENLTGYTPEYDFLDYPIQIDPDSLDYGLDSLKIMYYESFVKTCKKAGIDLRVVCSPYYLKANSIHKSVLIGQNLTSKYDIPFYDNSNDSIFNNNPKYFSNVLHLNDAGSRIFSKILIDEIQKDNSNIKLKKK